MLHCRNYTDEISSRELFLGYPSISNQKIHILDQMQLDFLLKLQRG
jgi:hypothetical protein